MISCSRSATQSLRTTNFLQDNARQALVEDRAALPRHEQACWSLQFKLRQLERKAARLEEQLNPSQVKT